MAIRTYISVINLNVNGLNAPIKRHRIAEWIQEQDMCVCVCVYTAQKRPLQVYRHTLKVRGWKKILHANRNQSQDCNT